MMDSCSDTEMWPWLWSSLPTELLERVLAFLPFPHLFRLRGVCKRWNALPHCAYFRQIRAQPEWGACLPVLFCKDATMDAEDEGWNSDSWSAYDTASRRWLRLPPLTCLDARHPKYLVVGSGGLLCIGDFNSTVNLVVCNPVTRACRELPRTLGAWAEPDLTAMAIERTSGGGGGYKLILAGNRSFSPGQSGYRATEVYSSATRAWTSGGPIPANLELHSQEGALCSNRLYCLARDPKRGAWNTLAAYDFATSQWSVVTQTIPHGHRTPHVIGSHDRVLVVAELQDPHQRALLFELDPATKKWRQVSELPHDLYVAIGKRVVACTVDGDYLCITGCSSSCWFSAMYRPSLDLWLQVPPFPVDESKGRDLCELLLSSSPFRPSLEPV